MSVNERELLAMRRLYCIGCTSYFGGIMNIALDIERLIGRGQSLVQAIHTVFPPEAHLRGCCVQSLILFCRMINRSMSINGLVLTHQNNALDSGIDGSSGMRMSSDEASD